MQTLHTLIIVDDNNEERRHLKSCLEAESFIVFDAMSAHRLIEIISNHRVDLILLNYGLPDGNAVDFLEAIRAHTDAPLILTSSKAQSQQKVAGLNMGADDFLIKPYDIQELIARINASLRRYHPHPADKDHAELSPAFFAKTIGFSNWILDRSRLQLFDTDGNTAGLSHVEFKLLEHFILSHQTVLSRREICQAVSKKCRHKIDEGALNIKILRLRRKIGDDAKSPRIIKTVREVGYFFDCPLKIID